MKPKSKKVVKKTTRKVKKKLKPFTALIIKNKYFDSVWTRELFSNEQQAYEYWQNFCERHHFDFNWDEFEIVPVEIIITKNK